MFMAKGGGIATRDFGGWPVNGAGRMASLSVAGLLVALVGILVLAQPAEAQRTDPRVERDAGRIYLFLVDTYLSGADLSAPDLREIYAPRLDRYWGRKNVAVTRVVRDKIAYFRRWPSRTFRLIEDTLAINPTIEDGVYAVSFEYGFRTEGARERLSEGFGATELTLLVNGEDVMVLAEDGRVIQRF